MTIQEASNCVKKLHSTGSVEVLFIFKSVWLYREPLKCPTWTVLAGLHRGFERGGEGLGFSTFSAFLALKFRENMGGGGGSFMGQQVCVL